MISLSVKYFVLLLLLAEAVFTVTLLYVSLPKYSRVSRRVAPLVEVAQAHQQQEPEKQLAGQAGEGWPVRLTIPEINVAAPVEYVGLTNDGVMDVPVDAMNAGWYELGASPGQPGSAVIAGHLNGKNGASGVFGNLGKLKPGDTLYTQDDKGSITTFLVRESRSYDPKADASAVFHSHDGKVHLNLITCEGEWSEQNNGYVQRLIVFADKE